MIKGALWLSLILLIGAEEWIVSSRSVSQRLRRQIPRRNTIYIRPLRNGQYIRPIPINFPPPLTESEESESSSTSSETSLLQSPWVPIRANKESKNKDVYRPLIRSPAVIVTRKPLENTWDIPLSKSIQVAQARPNIQTTGYIRKNVVKVYATRTTTENPGLRSFGSLAESTVHTLLNFTPVDEGWRPKSPTTIRPKPSPVPRYGTKLGKKVNQHLSYTGVRFGKVDSVVRSKPKNDNTMKVAKNETNFLMRFTPEDIKYTAVEVKTQKVQSPFFDDSPEAEQVEEEQNTRGNGQPYNQGGPRNLREKIKFPVRDQTVVVTTGSGGGRNPNQKHQGTTFGGFQKPNIYPSVLNKPLESKKIQPEVKPTVDIHTTDEEVYLKESPTKGFSSDPTGKNYKTYFIEPSNIHNVENSHQQQIQSNLPYQGLSKPSNKATSTQENARNVNLKYGGNSPYFDTTLKSETGSSNINKDIPGINSNVYFDDSKQHVSNSFPKNFTDLAFGSKEVPFPSPYGKAYNYDSAGNFFHNNRTQTKDSITVAEIPLAVGIEYDNESVISHKPINVDTKLQQRPRNLSKSTSFESHKYSPKIHSGSSVSNEDQLNAYKLKNGTQNIIEEISEPVFQPKSKPEEQVSKSFPKFLQFDDDFFKPAVSTNFATSVISDNLPRETNNDKVTGQVKEPPSVKFSQILNSFQPVNTKVDADYYNKTSLVDFLPVKHPTDDVHFQPTFPETAKKNLPDKSQTFQNYGEAFGQPADASKSRSPVSSGSVRVNLIPIISHNTEKKNKGVKTPVIVNYSPQDTRNNIGTVPTGTISNLPELITQPQVITVNNDVLLDHKAETVLRPNRSDNYVIQRKPALFPESSGKPRKPKITLSTGMLAGILIAALVFLGFLTGSMVYAFHQWKFGRKRGDRSKKVVRTPGFPPEYLDENFAGNTYIHNNIFLPTPQNMEERPNTDQENNSAVEEENATEEPPLSSRVRRQHRTFRDIRDD